MTSVSPLRDPGWFAPRRLPFCLPLACWLAAILSVQAQDAAFVAPTPPPVLPGGPTTLADADRLLIQATFGPTDSDLAEVQARGISHYLHRQMTKVPASSHVAYLDQVGVDPTATNVDPTMQAWWQYAVNAPDQLRQRVAFAWSEIMVASTESAGLRSKPYAMSAYMDVLVKDAFANYRQLLQDVTLNPAMGAYLNMLHNAKADPVKGTHPNQNYGREVLQLFSIGLNQLNPDGSPQLDANGVPIPTYGQDTVDGFSQVFTGWYFAEPGASAPVWNGVAPDWRDPMVAVPAYHDENPKTLLNGAVLPAGGTPEGDLGAALDNIYHHPNVGPFICRQLIERLVTSNPTPGYVYRVTSVFNDDGTGVRGNLQAVTKAIFTDFEARDPVTAAGKTFGKQREPIVRVANTMRAFHAVSSTGIFPIYYTDDQLGQTVMRSPSVFNFFSPDYEAPGRLAQRGLVAPEFQITSETQSISSANYLHNLIYTGLGDRSGKITLDLSSAQSLAGDPEGMVDHLNTLLMAGEMSTAMHDTLVAMVSAIPANQPLERARSAVQVIVTSSEFIIQK